jgi:alpha-L-fucosidase
MKTHGWILFVLTLGSLFCFVGCKSELKLEETMAQKDQRMEWWRQDRFGMFIHWGLYAIPAGTYKDKQVPSLGEWIRRDGQIPVEEYDLYVDQFNPTQFDADRWAAMAKDAGMKYIVITSKHHDGFCLWDSAMTDFDVMSTPFKRDILKELKAACRRQGVTLCFYHSIMDWHHPDYLPRRQWEQAVRPVGDADFERYVRHMKRQLKELVDRYDPAVLWFDGEWEDTWTHERGKDLYAYVRSLKPEIIINNRVDNGRKGSMKGFSEEGYAGDFGTPEQEIPPTGLPGADWETCMTMNDTWGYKSYDHNWKSTEQLIRMLVDAASKGGNFLLNVGPTADGNFPPESVQRLKEIGDWMDLNSDSIYGTKASPFQNLPWGRCTQKVRGRKTLLYLHVFDWPQDGKLLVPALQSPVKKCRLLANGKSLDYTQSEEGVLISLPANPPDPIDTVLVLEVKNPLVIKELETQ